jgi:hypothetical protein
MTEYIVLSYIVSAAVTGFALSRPSSAWLHADRDKSWWITSMVVMTLFGPVGLIGAATFLVGVLPRMYSARAPLHEERYDTNPFRKH